MMIIMMMMKTYQNPKSELIYIYIYIYIVINIKNINSELYMKNISR